MNVTGKGLTKGHGSEEEACVKQPQFLQVQEEGVSSILSLQIHYPSHHPV